VVAKGKRILRSLYDCSFARVKGNTIYCAKGYALGDNGTLNTNLAAIGEPLVMDICQYCADFELAGDDFIKPNERGWLYGQR